MTDKPLVLVTRPAEEAIRTAMALAEHGYDFLIEPLLEITRLPDAAQRLARAGDAVALLFTSANGVRAYAAVAPGRDLPVYAVGKLTADAAREAGFARIEIAGGDVDSLAELVPAQCRPDQGRLLHVAGAHVAGDLAGRLSAKGYEVETVALYSAKAADSLSLAAQEALTQGRLDAALFFSPRTARTFVSLVRTAGLDTYCRSCLAVCLSSAVAETAGELAWRGVLIADKPGIGPMIDALMPALPADSATETKTEGGMADSDKETEIALPAGEVIQRFGGIRPMAAKLGISFSTVQGWKERDHIPPARHAEIAAYAKTHDISLAPAEPRAEAQPPPAETKPAEAPSFRQTRVVPPDPAAADKPPPVPPPLTPQAAPPEVHGLGVFGAAFVSIVIVALAFAGAYYLRDHWMDEQAAMPAPTQPSVDKVLLDSLAVRLAKLEAQPASSGGGVAADPKLAEQVAALEKRVGDLQTALYAARDQAKRDSDAATATASQVVQAAQAGAAEQAKALAALSQRIEALEKGTDPAAFIALRNSLNELSAKLDAAAKRIEAAERASTGARAEGLAEAALALSVGQLRRAVDGGAAFASELQSCRALAGNDAAMTAALDALQPFAQGGVAPRAALTSSFADTAAAIAGSTRQRTGDGLWQRFVAWLSSLVSVRRVGEDAAGESPAAKAARAEAKLAKGDLAGAVAELGGLGAPAGDAAKPWFDRANARLAADKALAALDARAAQSLAQRVKP